MATKKKNNSRKALAVALGIMGVAGLSLASASQLNITPSQNIAVGTTTFVAACDDAVSVSYTYDTVGFTNYTDLVVSGINQTAPNKCEGKTLKYTLKDNTGVQIMTGTVTVGTAVTQSIAIAQQAPGVVGPVSLTKGLGALDLVIY